MRRSWSLILAAWLCLSSASAETNTADAIARWIFSAEHHTDGAFQPIEGGWPLAHAEPRFIGEGETQSLLLPLQPQLISVADPVEANELPGKKCSIEAWVAMDTHPTWGGIFSAIEDNGGAETGIFLGSRQRCFAFGLSSKGTGDHDGQLTYLTADGAIQRGRWYHVVGTYDGKTQRLYVIGIPRMLVGTNLSARASRFADQGTLLGMGWLEHHYQTMHGTPALGDNLYCYYYGVERVGAFFNTELIGRHPWYCDGAEDLIGRQKDDGHWGNQCDTCFALLFLRRASAPRQSGQPASRESSVFADSTGDVHIRATGSKRLTFWVQGFGERILEELEEKNRPWRGLRVVRVDYLADGAPVSTAPGDPSKPWRGDRYASQHTFALPGKHTLQARVTVVTPDGDPEHADRTEILESVVLEVETKSSPEDWMARNLELAGEDLLVLARPIATASSERKGCGPAFACDDLHSTRWVCADGDDRPWIHFKLTRGARADSLVLSQANSTLAMRGEFGAIQKVGVSINGNAPVEVDMGPDDLDQVRVDLGHTVRVRELEVAILELTRGRDGQGAGFSGVKLIRR